MQLVTQELREKLPPLYSQEHVADPMVFAKFFHPLTSYAWFATEFDGDDTFFGWVYGPNPELGYFSLDEMNQTFILGVGMERDLDFEPTLLSVVKSWF